MDLFLEHEPLARAEQAKVHGWEEAAGVYTLRLRGRDVIAYKRR